MGHSKRKLGNIEEHNVPDPASAVTPSTTCTQVHSEYASDQAARHWTVSTSIHDSELLTEMEERQNSI
jgi:hypothetical protein